MGLRSNMLALAALALAGTASAQPKVAPVPLESTAHPELWPQVAWPETLTPAQEARVQALIGQMSLACKAGQVIQADILKVAPEEVASYHLGSVLNGGSSGPHGNDFAPPPEWLALADQFYDASMKPTDGCPAIPVMWGIDAVHGQNNIIGATLFPHNVGLGATARHGPDGAHRRRRRAGNSGDRPGLDLRADHCRAAGLSLGPLIRGLRLRSGARGDHGPAYDPRPAGQSLRHVHSRARPRRRHRQALSGRRRHVRRP